MLSTTLKDLVHYTKVLSFHHYIPPKCSQRKCISSRALLLESIEAKLAMAKKKYSLCRFLFAMANFGFGPLAGPHLSRNRDGVGMIWNANPAPHTAGVSWKLKRCLDLGSFCWYGLEVCCDEGLLVSETVPTLMKQSQK